MLMNYGYSKKKKSAFLNLDAGICIQFEKFAKSKGHLSQLLERIFQYSENQRQHDPVWGLSDNLGKNKGIDAAKNAFYSILPPDIKEDFKQTKMYEVLSLWREEDFRDGLLLDEESGDRLLFPR